MGRLRQKDQELDVDLGFLVRLSQNGKLASRAQGFVSFHIIHT
jgi:hypothetical protein